MLAWWNVQGGSYVAICHDEAFGTRAPPAPREPHAEEVVDGNGEVVPWRPLFYQDVGAVFLEAIVHALEGDVVGVAVYITATWRIKGRRYDATEQIKRNEGEN